MYLGLFLEVKRVHFLKLSFLLCSQQHDHCQICPLLSPYQLKEECRLVCLQSGLLVRRSGVLEEVILGMELRSCGELLDELQYR